jgi:hypothetical protein
MRLLMLLILAACSQEGVTIAEETPAEPQAAIGCQLLFTETDPTPEEGQVCDKALTMEGKAFTKTAIGWSEPMQIRGMEGPPGKDGVDGKDGAPGKDGTTLTDKQRAAIEMISAEVDNCCWNGNQPITVRMGMAQFILMHLSKQGHGRDEMGKACQ